MPSISAQPPPLPSASTLLAEVRSSCSQYSTAIDEDALDALLEEVAASPEPPSLKDYSLVMPLRWDSVGAEINFFSLVAVLSILSPLQCHINELPGGDNTPAMLVRQLLVGLYLSAPPSNHLSAPSPLSSAHLAALQENEVAEVLNLKIHVEKSVAHIPVATLAERGGPGSEIVARLTTTLNRVGQRLSDNRYVDLGAFVVETLAQCKGKASEEEALGTFVHRVSKGGYERRARVVTDHRPHARTARLLSPPRLWRRLVHTFQPKRRQTTPRLQECLVPLVRPRLALRRARPAVTAVGPTGIQPRVPAASRRRARRLEPRIKRRGADGRGGEARPHGRRVQCFASLGRCGGRKDQGERWRRHACPPGRVAEEDKGPEVIKKE